MRTKLKLARGVVWPTQFSLDKNNNNNNQDHHDHSRPSAEANNKIIIASSVIIADADDDATARKSSPLAPSSLASSDDGAAAAAALAVVASSVAQDQATTIGQRRNRLRTTTTTTSRNKKNDQENSSQQFGIGGANLDNNLENLAPKFKHHANECAQDIKLIRQLLRNERSKQSQELQDFYASEFKRLMLDDWLVTRFLLRGAKQAASGRGHSTTPATTTTTTIDQTSTIVLMPAHCETMLLIEACAKFKWLYQIGAELSLEQFPKEWIEREGILVHGFDRSGNASIYLRCKLHKPKLIETKEARHLFKRLMLFQLSECDSKLINREGRAICCIFDMSGVSLENLDLELLAWMVSSFKHCSPKLLAYVIVYNLPWLFNATFRLLTNGLLSRSHQQSIRFVYGRELLHYFDFDSLPSYLQQATKKQMNN